MNNSQIQLLSPMSLVHFSVCVKSMSIKTHSPFPGPSCIFGSGSQQL